MEYFLEPGDLIDRIRNMLRAFSLAQATLIRQDPHEDAIVDALKPFLYEFFHDFPNDINHNYDLMHSDNEMVRKAGEFLRSELPKNKIPKKSAPDQEVIVKRMLPDYILHDLTSGVHNFLIIEVKKTTNINQHDRVWDRLKLTAATSGHLNYTYGCFVDIATGDDVKKGKASNFVLYMDGEAVYHEAV
ncbi:MAG: hypothetical protein IPG86_01340 [Chitinophagaceae bacterium]|nr:hypothetical protein [Chitinophagaceae bacterium]